MRVTKLLDPVTSGPPLPSHAVLALAGMAMLCLGLLAALVLSTSEQSVTYAPSPEIVSGGGASPGLSGPPSSPEASGETPAAAPGAEEEVVTESVAVDSLLAAFPEDARPIPATTIAQLEGASEQALEVELGYLLDAIRMGFGDRSAQLEPSLRPYLFRIAGRLSVRTETFRLAVTAPDVSLARARAATLRRLFDLAGIPASRLAIDAGAGSHALSLVSD